MDRPLAERPKILAKPPHRKNPSVGVSGSVQPPGYDGIWTISCWPGRKAFLPFLTGPNPMAQKCLESPGLLA